MTRFKRWVSTFTCSPLTIRKASNADGMLVHTGVVSTDRRKLIFVDPRLELDTTTVFWRQVRFLFSRSGKQSFSFINNPKRADVRTNDPTPTHSRSKYQTKSFEQNRVHSFYLKKCNASNETRKRQRQEQSWPLRVVYHEVTGSGSRWHDVTQLHSNQHVSYADILPSRKTIHRAAFSLIAGPIKMTSFNIR